MRARATHSCPDRTKGVVCAVGARRLRTRLVSAYPPHPNVYPFSCARPTATIPVAIR